MNRRHPLLLLAEDLLTQPGKSLFRFSLAALLVFGNQALGGPAGLTPVFAFAALALYAADIQIELTKSIGQAISAAVIVMVFVGFVASFLNPM